MGPDLSRPAASLPPRVEIDPAPGQLAVRTGPLWLAGRSDIVPREFFPAAADTVTIGR